MRKRRLDSDGLSRWQVNNKERNVLSVNTEENIEMVVKVIAERNCLLLWSNNYNVSSKIMEHKLSEQDASLKAVTVSVKRLETKLRLLENARITLQKINEKLTRR